MMKNSKAIQCLRSLNAREIRQFKMFLASPFHNKKVKVLTLFDYLKKFHKHNFDHPNLTEENTLSSVFGTKKADRRQLQNLMTELTRLFERFLIQSEFEQETHLHNRLLLHALYKKRQYHFFKKVLPQARKLLQKEAIIESGFFYDNYLLEELEYTFDIATKGRPVETNLQQVINNFDLYALATKLRYYCTILNYENIMNVQYNIAYTEDLNASGIRQLAAAVPYIDLYYHLFILLKNDSTVGFEQLKIRLQKYRKEVSKNELRQIYIAAINYCNKLLKKGDATYWKEIFKLYQSMVADELIYANGFIRPALNFRNIVMVALKVGETDWAMDFIAKNKDKVPPDHQENLVTYCTAAIHFYKKEYRETVYQLAKYKLEDFYNYIEHKTLLIKAYFELEEDEALFSLAEAFRVYLLRDTLVPQSLKTSYNNFLRFVKRINQALPEQYPVLKQELEKINNVTEKNWLLLKLTEK